MRNHFLKFVVLFAATILFSTISMMAQDAPPPRVKKDVRTERQRLSPEEKATKRTEKMAETLELSADQAEAISAIHLKYIQEFDAIRAQQIEDREQKRAAMKELRNAQKAEVEQILTPEQAQKLAELKKEHKEKRRGMRRGGRGRTGGQPNSPR